MFADELAAAVAAVKKSAGSVLAAQVAMQAGEAAVALAVADSQAAVAAVNAIQADPVTPPVVTPPVITVTNLAVKATGQGELTATWSNPTPAPASITVGRDGVQADGGGSNWSGPIPGSSTSQKFDKLADNTAYTVTVTPAGGSASSVKATTLPAVIPPAPTPTPTPSGTAPLGAPAGSTWKIKEAVDWTKTTSVDLSMWQKNRWDDGKNPADVTDEQTNIPSSQDDSSYSENVKLGADGLELWTCPQVDTAQFPDKPFCGAHFGRRQAVLTAGTWIEWDMKVNVNGGGTWSGIVHYGNGSQGAGEIDGAEYGNTRTNKTPTCNAHHFDANGNQNGQEQSGYTGSPQLAGDGKVHTYGQWQHPDGKTWSFYLDGKLVSADKTAIPGIPMVPWLEVGVPKGEKPNTGAVLVLPAYRVFQAA